MTNFITTLLFFISLGQIFLAHAMHNQSLLISGIFSLTGLFIAKFMIWWLFRLFKVLKIKAPEISEELIGGTHLTPEIYSHQRKTFFDGLTKALMNSPIGATLTIYGGARALEQIREPVNERLHQFIFDLMKDEKAKEALISGLIHAQSEIKTQNTDNIDSRILFETNKRRMAIAYILIWLVCATVGFLSRFLF
jgi:hypothetical protein